MRADARRNRERILAAAEAVFAEKGPSASTEDIATTAGVAIGTVFRHFPTKQALLQTILKDLLIRFAEEASRLAAGGDPARALFAFLAHTVEQAAQQRGVVDLLAESGVDVSGVAVSGVDDEVAEPVRALREGVAELLTRSREAGAVRQDVGVDEVIALLTALCQGALRAGWDRDLRHRTVGIVLDGLRPPALRLGGGRRPAAQ